MKVNLIKFFRGNKPEPIPQPKPSDKPRFEYIKKGNKLDKFL